MITTSIENLKEADPNLSKINNNIRSIIRDQEQRKKEWDEVENLTMLYKKQFEDDCDDIQAYESQLAAEELLQRFSPFFRKYMNLFKSGQIDFDDPEMKSFVYTFMHDASLKKALKRRRQTATYRKEIYKRFNFVKETYGSLPEEEIEMDLHMLFLVLLKRYKQTNRSFCGYMYNAFKFEMSRHIKKFISDPINIHYKNAEYEDNLNGMYDVSMDSPYEDRYYEDEMGLPDLCWIAGDSCSEIFSSLSNSERKILVKYYLEDCNDKQIAEMFDVHINTINQKRRVAAFKVADTLNIGYENIKRRRRSGMEAMAPSTIH